MRSRVLIITSLILLIVVVVVAAWPFINKRSQASGAVNVFASPIQGGCYIAGPNDCRIHIDPFTINLNTAKKLVFFQLIANPVGGSQSILYDFRTDQSNPAPAIGNTYSPSLVTQDFAATCGKKYFVNLEGQDSGDSNPLNMGSTTQFTCPSVVP